MHKDINIPWETFTICMVNKKKLQERFKLQTYTLKSSRETFFFNYVDQQRRLYKEFEKYMFLPSIGNVMKTKFLIIIFCLFGKNLLKISKQKGFLIEHDFLLFAQKIRLVELFSIICLCLWVM